MVPGVHKRCCDFALMVLRAGQIVCLCSRVISHRQEQSKQARPAIHTTTINP